MKQLGLGVSHPIILSDQKSKRETWKDGLRWWHHPDQGRTGQAQEETR